MQDGGGASTVALSSIANDDGMPRVITIFPPFQHNLFMQI
jgi:hypothetical protein